MATYNPPSGSSVISADNTVWVDAAFGNDATGARERQDKPFATLSAAQAAAVAGDTIIVRPGQYDDFGLGKDKVNWSLQKGVLIKPTAAGSGIRAVFIDGDGSSPMTFGIFGAGRIENNQANSGYDVLVGMMTQNAGSVMTLELDSAELITDVSAIVGYALGGKQYIRVRDTYLESTALTPGLQQLTFYCSGGFQSIHNETSTIVTPTGASFPADVLSTGGGVGDNEQHAWISSIQRIGDGNECLHVDGGRAVWHIQMVKSSCGQVIHYIGGEAEIDINLIDCEITRAQVSGDEFGLFYGGSGSEGSRGAVRIGKLYVHGDYSGAAVRVVADAKSSLQIVECISTNGPCVSVQDTTGIDLILRGRFQTSQNNNCIQYDNWTNSPILSLDGCTLISDGAGKSVAAAAGNAFINIYQAVSNKTIAAEVSELIGSIMVTAERYLFTFFDTGWTAPPSTGSKSDPVESYSGGGIDPTMASALNVISSGLGDALVQDEDRLKELINSYQALYYALASKLLPTGP